MGREKTKSERLPASAPDRAQHLDPRAVVRSLDAQMTRFGHLTGVPGRTLEMDGAVDMVGTELRTHFWRRL